MKIGRKKKKEKTISQLKKEADKHCSIYVRRRDKGVCFTCGTRQEWQYMQNGHYESRSHLGTRYDDRNCNCQCVACNVFKRGNLQIYALRLQEKHGAEILKELNNLRRAEIKNPRKFYENHINFYKNKISELN